MGYGVYVTDRRVAGVHTSRSDFLLLIAGFLIAVFGIVGLSILASIIYSGTLADAQNFGHGIGAIAGVLFFGFLGYLYRRMKRRAPNSFQELPAKTDFSVRREEIAQIQLKEPTKWHTGHLAIATSQGSTMKIVLILGRGQLASNDFSQLRSLMQKFCAGSLVKLDLVLKSSGARNSQLREKTNG